MGPKWATLDPLTVTEVSICGVHSSSGPCSSRAMEEVEAQKEIPWILFVPDRDMALVRSGWSDADFMVNFWNLLDSRRCGGAERFAAWKLEDRIGVGLEKGRYMWGRRNRLKLLGQRKGGKMQKD